MVAVTRGKFFPLQALARRGLEVLPPQVGRSLRNPGPRGRRLGFGSLLPLLLPLFLPLISPLPAPETWAGRGDFLKPDL